MKIAVMGTGGVGAYYGGLLATKGHDVTFMARGAHLEAIRAHGLQVNSIHGDFSILPAKATDNPTEVGVVDWVMFCVKTTATDQAVQAIRPLVGSQTTVTSLQNGVDAAERIGAVIGMEHMLPGATWLSSAVEAPGVVKQVSQFHRVVLGELDGSTSFRLQAIYTALAETGITVEMSEDILKVLWTKFTFIAAVSGISSITRLEMGDYRAVPETRVLLTGLMREVEAVARAKGIALDQDVVEKTLAFIDNSAPHIKTSMQRDFEAGRPSELESMIGIIGRKGREMNIPTPVADFVYACLLPVDLKARQMQG
jgi:2-dehydropantoate 2-reductase